MTRLRKAQKDIGTKLWENVVAFLGDSHTVSPHHQRLITLLLRTLKNGRVRSQFFDLPRSFNLLVLALDAIQAHQPDLQGGGTAFRYVTKLPQSMSRIQAILVLAHLLVRPSLDHCCPREVEQLLVAAVDVPL